jgi:peptidyl-prolyl cis-trans isomerase SurA
MFHSRFFNTLLVILSVLTVTLEAQVTDQPALMIGGAVVTLKEFTAIQNFLQAQADQRGHQGKLSKQEVKQYLIDRSLLLAYAKDMGLGLTQEEYARVEKAMLAQKQVQSLENLQQRLLSEGIDPVQFMKSFRAQAGIEKLQQSLINPQELLVSKDFEQYKSKMSRSMVEYKVLDYLLPEKSTDQQILTNKAKAWRLSTKALSQPDVTDMGWLTLNQLPDIFSAQVVKLKKGGVSKPILAGNGWHLLKLEDTRRTKDALNQDQIIQSFLAMKAAEAQKTLLKTVSDQYEVKVFDCLEKL